MRKLLVAVIAAAALFAVGAFAASFTVQSEDVASGSDPVEACAERVDVDFATLYQGGGLTNDWQVTGATVTFYDADSGPTLATDCDGFNVTVVLEQFQDDAADSGVVIATGTGSVANDGTASVTNFSPSPVAVGNVGRASVLIDGKTLFANDIDT